MVEHEGQRRALKYDRELLCVATVLHDLGLTTLAPVQARFEIEGADAARALVQAIQEVLDKADQGGHIVD